MICLGLRVLRTFDIYRVFVGQKTIYRFQGGGNTILNASKISDFRQIN